jgi:hypothetical protein
MEARARFTCCCAGIGLKPDREGTSAERFAEHDYSLRIRKMSRYSGAQK